MRAATDTRLLEVDPGSTTSVVVDIVNNGEVIDGVTANVIGLADEYVHTQPSLLPLFPATSGQLTVSLTVPSTHPAGRHPITLELVSHGARMPSQYLDVDLDVSARPSMAMAPVPRVVRARRSGRFVLEVTNDGNVPLDVAMHAVDVERSIKATFTPPRLHIAAGAVAPVLLHVRGPRMFTGGESDRPVQVSATATRADLPDDADPGPEDAAVEPRQTAVRLRQRPLVSRGLLTALILMSIVALWAGVFLLGLTKVFSNDPMTKAAPASFFVKSKAPTAAGTSGAHRAAGEVVGADAAAAPAGALPKSGQLPPGLGGEITGVVTSASDEQPVGRILVQAYRIARDGPVLVSSAATQSDGSYTLAGLFPTSYYLQFSAKKLFKDVWYPDAPTRAGARAVNADAQLTTSGINVVITGLPASISGSVDPGDKTKSVTTVVTAQPLNLAGSASEKKVSTHGGKYKITGLKAPASYQLTFKTEGYETTSIVDAVSGGDTRLEPTVMLGASQGGITGIVVSGNSPNSPPLGGATVSTTVGGKIVSVLTPTTLAVGTFVLPNLPTPGTYVLRYSAPNHGSATEVISLGPGESNNKAIGRLAVGVGSISGVVKDGAGHPLGGVTVTVGGAASAGTTTGTTSTGTAGNTVTSPSTTTLTSPPVGKFFLNGLAAGDYTLTFALDGYAPASVMVTIDSAHTAPITNVQLAQQLGAITGIVTRNGSGDPGVTVTATDGLTSFTATSSAAGGQLAAGGYLIGGLPPGTYTVTAAALGQGQQTRIVTVPAGVTVKRQNLRLAG